MNFENLLKNKNLSESSINTYVSILKNTGFTEDTILNNPVKVIDYIKKKKNLSTKKTALSACYKLSSNPLYKNAMLEIIKEYNKEVNKQEKTITQKENWATSDLLKEKFEYYKNHWNNKNSNFTNKQNFILLALLGGFYIPPRRLKDYTNFKINNIDEIKDNYLKGKKLYFNSYKGSDKKGLQIVPIPNELYYILKKWIKYNKDLGNDYLFTNDKGEQMSNVVLNQKLNKIFQKKISVNALRHSYLSYKYTDVDKKTDELNKEMLLMGSSVLQKKIYIKK
jgi:integrase